MKNSIINEQLKIAIDYWTKVLNESNDAQQQQDAVQQQKSNNMYEAISDGTIDISKFKISFTVRSQYAFNDAGTTFQTCDLKITSFNVDKNVCYCALATDETKCMSVNLLKLQTAFKMDYDNMMFALPGKNEDTIFTCKMDHIERGIIFAYPYMSTINLGKMQVYKYDPRIIESVDMSKSSIQYIYDNAYADCINMVDFKFNDTLRGIQTNAFKNCVKLGNVTIPETTMYIQSCAFRNCNFSSVILPKAMDEIENNAFLDCTNLTNITLPQYIYMIQPWAFKNTRIKHLDLNVWLVVRQKNNHFDRQCNHYNIDSMPELESLTINSVGRGNGSNAMVHIYNCPKLKFLKFLTDDAVKSCFYVSADESRGNTVFRLEAQEIQEIRIEVPSEQSKKHIESVYGFMYSYSRALENKKIDIVVV